MNWLDYVLIALFALSTLQSFRRGFSREIVGLISSVAALILGMWLYGTASGLFSSWVASQRVANFLGFLTIVAAVLIAGGLIGRIVNRFMRVVGLSFLDRLLGAAFGLVRGAAIAVALMTAYMAFGPHAGSKSAPAAVVNSRIAPYLLSASRLAVDAAPMELKRDFSDAYDNVKAEWQQALQILKDKGSDGK